MIAVSWQKVFSALCVTTTPPSTLSLPVNGRMGIGRCRCARLAPLAPLHALIVLFFDISVVFRSDSRGIGVKLCCKINVKKSPRTKIGSRRVGVWLLPLRFSGSSRSSSRSRCVSLGHFGRLSLRFSRNCGQTLLQNSALKRTQSIYQPLSGYSSLLSSFS